MWKYIYLFLLLNYNVIFLLYSKRLLIENYIKKILLYNIPIILGFSIHIYLLFSTQFEEDKVDLIPSLLLIVYALLLLSFVKKVADIEIENERTRRINKLLNKKFLGNFVPKFLKRFI